MTAELQAGHRTLPLRGKRVLITRAKSQAEKLRQLLEAEGAEVLAIPAIEIIAPESYGGLDAALRDMCTYDWLVLTSANAVHAIARRAAEVAVPIETLCSVFIAAIGKSTADAVTALGLAVELIPPRAVAESLAEALAPHVASKRILIVRAQVARDVLPERLLAAGASVTIAEAYRAVMPGASNEALREAFARSVDAITFTSASSVRNFFALCEDAGVVIAGETKKISIGPITSQALIDCGYRVDAEGLKASLDALVAAVCHAFERRL